MIAGLDCSNPLASSHAFCYNPGMSETVVIDGAFVDDYGILRRPDGKFAAPPPEQAITTQNAREKQVRSVEARRRRKIENKRAGILKALEAKGINAIDIDQADAEAVAIIVEEVVLNKKESGLARIKGYERIWADADLRDARPERNEADARPGLHISLTLPPEQMAAAGAVLARLMGGSAPGEMEGEAADGE